MLTSQPTISGVQSKIGPNPMANLGSAFPPYSGTLVGSMVMSTIGPFGWDWNIGVSEHTVS